MFKQFLLALTLVLATTATASASITRTRVENFLVEPGTHIEVKINGGPIIVKVGPPGQVHIELIQTVGTDSEKVADNLIAKTSIIEQNGQRIRVVLESEGYNLSWSWLHSWLHGDRGVRLIVPAKVDLNLDASGGPIKVDGEIQGELRANTSGGPISLTGGTGKLDLDTSGGSISVDRVFHQIHADTSGGSIRIGYVSPDVMDVDADTSGGGISIGLDPAGNYDLHADASGGSVNVKELQFEASRMDRTHAEGKVNRGGARVRADTSGGNVEIHAAHL